MTATVLQKHSLGILCGLLLVSGHWCWGQALSTRVSTRETYVGMPVILQIQISNPQEFDLPDPPQIDGCEVKANGAPSQSRHFTIINGVRNESRTITMQYLITPMEAGEFEVPALEVNVDGKIQKSKPFAIVATKSETGDLLFVEVAGGQEKVYVGEPLELKLSIWIKPFRDRTQQVKLTEGQMWQLISDQSTWGSFSDRMQEMATNNRRPGGKEVLRDNGEGERAGYYQYVMNATVYPTRAGSIDASDVKIVVNYPTALGRSRDPFENFFGRNSLLKQMMDDDFLGSPFGGQLSVSASRPVVANANVDATEVIPIPMKDRPADYRGAVGRYQIVAKSDADSVAAGDPVTLRIGVQGTGPMELVQAPPLAEIESLTNDFKVADQNLAGFVRDDTKIFVTTIRPRHERVKSIPAIPFSYFDPETESFQTAYSDPIPIRVDAAETLSMDSIVSNSSRPRRDAVGDRRDPSKAKSGASWSANLENDLSEEVLDSQETAAAASQGAWWYCTFVPPIVWMAMVMTQVVRRMLTLVPDWRPPGKVCLTQIESATQPVELTSALLRLIAKQIGKVPESTSQAVGWLRMAGIGNLANDVESFFHDAESDFQNGPELSNEKFLRMQTRCHSLTESLETAFATNSRRDIIKSPFKKIDKRWTAGVLLLTCIAGGRSDAFGDDVVKARTQLSRQQQASILAEANELYLAGQDQSSSDRAEANDLFAQSAEKYQLLFESGVRNSRLQGNLGNAYLQSGQLGRAIAAYHRALRHDPRNGQAQANLRFAEARVSSMGEHAAKSPRDSEVAGAVSTAELFRSTTQRLVGLIGMGTLRTMLGAASLLFWGLLIARLFGVGGGTIRLAVLPLVLLIFSGSLVWMEQPDAEFQLAILTSQPTELRLGDGEEFDVEHRFENSTGRPVKLIDRRGDWLRIRTPDDREGWIPANEAEQIDSLAPDVTNYRSNE